MQRSGNLEMQMMLQEEEAKQALRDFRNALNLQEDDQIIKACAKLVEFSEQTETYGLKPAVKNAIKTLSGSDQKELTDEVNSIFKDPTKLGELTEAIHSSENAKANDWEDWGAMDEEGAKLNREEYKQTVPQTKEERIEALEARWDDVRIKLGDAEHLARVLEKYLIQPKYHKDSLFEFYVKMGNVDEKLNYSYNQDGEKIVALLDEGGKQRLKEEIRQLLADPDKLEKLLAQQNGTSEEQHQTEEKDNKSDNDHDEQQSDHTPKHGT